MINGVRRRFNWADFGQSGQGVPKSKRVLCYRSHFTILSEGASDASEQGFVAVRALLSAVLFFSIPYRPSGGEARTVYYNFYP